MMEVMLDLSKEPPIKQGSSSPSHGKNVDEEYKKAEKSGPNHHVLLREVKFKKGLPAWYGSPIDKKKSHFDV
jgi:hypothetical protein